MEECLWRIDVNPTELSKLEDGEISESDNESRNGSKTNRPGAVPNSTASTSGPTGEGGGDPSSSSGQSNSNDQTDSGQLINKPNVSRPVKKKPFKKKANFSSFNYSNLSEEELQNQFRLVHQKLQFMESSPQLNSNSQPADLLAGLPVNLPSSSPNSLSDGLPTNLQTSGPVPANQPMMNLPSNLSNAFPTFVKQQTNQHVSKKPHPNQQFVFQQPTNRPPPFNPKGNKKFKPPNQQQLFYNYNCIDNNLNMNDLKKLFNQLKKLIMANSKPKPNQQNKNFNKNANQRRFQTDSLGDPAGTNQSNVNANNNQPHMFAGQKRKLIDKNGNPMKRPNNKNFNNPINTNNKNFYNSINTNNNNGTKKHPVFASTYNQPGTPMNQPAFTSSFSPVITSDLFGATNQFKHNQNFNNNKNRRRPLNQVCKYFLLGSCHKGDHCEFRHAKDKNTKINELCKFYIQNACDKGKSIFF